MNTTKKINRGYYLTKANKIIPVQVFWTGWTKTGKYLARVAFLGKDEKDAFWVDADRLSLARHTLERAQRNWNDDNGIY